MICCQFYELLSRTLLRCLETKNAGAPCATPLFISLNLCGHFTYQIGNKHNQGSEITNCRLCQSRTKYAMTAMRIYEIGTGKIFKMPVMVRHLPETNSTTRTKLTTVTVMEAKPASIRTDMNIAKLAE